MVSRHADDFAALPGSEIRDEDHGRHSHDPGEAEAGAQAGRLVVIDDVLRALMMEHVRKVVGAGRVGDIYSCHQPARDGLVQVGAVALPDALSSMDRQPATSVPENTLVSRVMLEDAGFDGNWTPVQPDLAAPRTPP